MSIYRLLPIPELEDLKNGQFTASDMSFFPTFENESLALVGDNSAG